MKSFTKIKIARATSIHMYGVLSIGVALSRAIVRSLSRVLTFTTTAYTWRLRLEMLGSDWMPSECCVVFLCVKEMVKGFVLIVVT